MVNAPQAVIKIIRNGGTHTPKEIKAQWDYISKEGTVNLERPESAHGANLERQQWSEESRHWAHLTGRYAPGQAGPSNIDMTTHIVVSFPPGTDPNDAYAAGRSWSERMFRPLDHDNDDIDIGPNAGAGDQFHPVQNYDYVSAFHTDRDHPHMHIVVNRRGSAHGWLKISRRHPVMNYTNMRNVLVDTAAENNIILEATTRAERGVEGQPPTDAELRRRARVPIPIIPRDQRDRSINSNSEGYLSYALDSAVDFRDFDNSEGDGSTISSESAGGGAGGGGRRRTSGGSSGGESPDTSQYVDNRRQGIPAEITIHAGGTARKGTPPDYDGDYESASEDEYTVQPHETRKHDRDDSQSDDGGGKPAALTGEALEAFRAAKRRRAGGTSDGGYEGSDDDSFDEEPRNPIRKRGRDSIGSQHEIDDSLIGEPAAPDISDEPHASARQRRRTDMDGRSDAQEAVADAATDVDDEPQVPDEQGLRRRNQPTRARADTHLRSDTERQRLADEAASMHLRSGRVVGLPESDRTRGGRPDDRNKRTPQR